MELKKFLEEIPDDRILYVGAASSFLAAGTKEKILKDLPKQDKKFQKRAEIKRSEVLTQYRAAQKNFGKEHDITTGLHQRYLEITDPIPFLDREVVSTFERTTEDALNIIVTGEETGTIWSLNEDAPLELNFNIEELVGAILREVVRDYKLGLKHELKTFQELLERLESYRKSSEQLEKYFHSKEIRRFLTVDPEYIIKIAREDLAETLAETVKKKP